MIRELPRTALPAPPLPPGRPNLVLTGFMGTGKTEAGRQAARRLRMPFVDLDEVVERRAEMPVAHIFSRWGEEEFRRLERGAIGEASRLSGTVVATGGGGVLDRDGFARLAEHAVVVVLTANSGTLQDRLAGDRGRPLLHPDPGRWIPDLLARRELLYAAAGDPLDTTTLTPEDVGVRLAERYPALGTSPLRLEVGGVEPPTIVAMRPGGLAEVGTALRTVLPEATAAAVVVDAAVADRLGASIGRALEGAGIRTGAPITLQGGEEAKSLPTLAFLWDRLHEHGLDRTDAAVAVGGGTVLDVAGLAAATFARGIQLVNVPTTLLAMVDASIGGKVAINHAGVKNRVGAFHHPALVVVDFSCLGTLPPEVTRLGLAECVKVAVLASPLVLDVLETMPVSGRGIPADLGWLVEQSIRAKIAYVTRDPGDRNLRQALNLGHTFAHAIEAAGGHRAPHGEAVAMGLVAAARLGANAGITDPGLAERLDGLLARLGLPTRPPDGLDPARLSEAMKGDKKRRSGRAVFVVPAPGGAELIEGLEPEEAIGALLPSHEGRSR